MDKKALILVVDDNSECRALLVWALELHNFRTISATCGLEAVELAIEFQPRLVLTDLSMPDIMALRAKNEPMAAKMALARHIVADFHSAESAEQAQADFDREVRHGDVPADIQAMDLPPDARAAEGIRMPKLLVAAGLAESRSDAERKLKAGAVEINGERVTDLLYSNGAGPMTVRVGKKWKRINL